MLGINIEAIRNVCANGAIRWSAHVLKAFEKRGLSRQGVISVINTGEVIEDYPEDKPFPSCLVSGYNDNGCVQHVVCALGAGMLWMITTYIPDLEVWNDDLVTRREKE